MHEIIYEVPETYGDGIITVVVAHVGDDKYDIVYFDGLWNISMLLPKEDTRLFPKRKHWPERYETLEAAKAGLEDIVAEICTQ